MINNFITPPEKKYFGPNGENSIILVETKIKFYDRISSFLKKIYLFVLKPIVYINIIVLSVIIFLFYLSHIFNNDCLTNGIKNTLISSYLANISSGLFAVVIQIFTLDFLIRKLESDKNNKLVQSLLNNDILQILQPQIKLLWNAFSFLDYENRYALLKSALKPETFDINSIDIEKLSNGKNHFTSQVYCLNELQKRIYFFVDSELMDKFNNYLDSRLLRPDEVIKQQHLPYHINSLLELSKLLDKYMNNDLYQEELLMLYWEEKLNN